MARGSVTGAVPKLVSEPFLRCSVTSVSMAEKTRHQSEGGARSREAPVSRPPLPSKPDADDEEASASDSSFDSNAIREDDPAAEIDDLMDSEGYAGPALPDKTVKPLTPEALAAFNAAQARSGVIYISRIPPGMQPAKVRHLLSQYGEVERVYLQQEGRQ